MRFREKLRLTGGFNLLALLSVAWCLIGLGVAKNSPPWLSVMQELDVNDEQRQKLEKTIYEHEKLLIDITADLRKKKLEMYRLLQSDAPNELAIMELAESIGKTEVKTHKAKLHLLLRLKEILSKQQYEKLKQLKQMYDDKRPDELAK